MFKSCEAVSHLDSKCGGSQASEAAIRMLLARQPRHGSSDEVQQASVAVVLHHAAQSKDHHWNCVWNKMTTIKSNNNIRIIFNNSENYASCGFFTDFEKGGIHFDYMSLSPLFHQLWTDFEYPFFWIIKFFINSRKYKIK